MRRNTSVRTRLTIYFTTVFGFIVVCLAVASYLVFRHQAYNELDSGLDVAASATALSAQHEMNEHRVQKNGETDLQEILDGSSQGVLRDSQILIREKTRDVAHKRSATTEVDLSSIPTAELRTRTEVSGLRISAREIQVPKFNTAYSIIAASAVAPTIARLDRFRNILLICVPLMLALAALEGMLWRGDR